MNKIIVPIDVSGGQFFVDLTVSANSKILEVDFKIDTGCNVVVLSRNTLKRFGIDVSQKALEKKKIPKTSIADNSMVHYRIVRNISLYSGRIFICEVPVICHTTRQTNNLLGVGVLHKFEKYAIQLKGETRMALFR